MDLEELTQLIETGSNLSDEQIQLCADLLTSIAVEDSPKKDFLVALVHEREKLAWNFRVWSQPFADKAISPNLDDFQDRAIDLCGTRRRQSRKF